MSQGTSDSNYLRLRIPLPSHILSYVPDFPDQHHRQPRCASLDSEEPPWTPSSPTPTARPLIILVWPPPSLSCPPAPLHPLSCHPSASFHPSHPHVPSCLDTAVASSLVSLFLSFLHPHPSPIHCSQRGLFSTLSSPALLSSFILPYSPPHSQHHHFSSWKALCPC